MAVVSPTDLTFGQRVEFKTLNDSDNCVYIGTITAIGNYPFARTMADLLPYSQAVLKSHPDLPPLEELTFLQLTILENGTQPSTIRVFAREWINPSTLKIIEDTSSFDLRIYGTTSEQTEQAIELLRSNGFTAQLLSTTNSQ